MTETVLTPSWSPAISTMSFMGMPVTRALAMADPPAGLFAQAQVMVAVWEFFSASSEREAVKAFLTSPSTLMVQSLASPSTMASLAGEEHTPVTAVPKRLKTASLGVRTS